MTAATYGEWDFAKTPSVAEATATPLYVVTADGISHLRTLMDGRYAVAADMAELTENEINEAWSGALNK